MTEALDRAVEEYADRAFDFLEELVSASSVVGAEQRALDVFAREAESVGLVTERLPFSNTPDADPRAGVTQSGCRPDRRALPGAREHAGRGRPDAAAQRAHRRRAGVDPGAVDLPSVRPGASRRPHVRPRHGGHEGRLRDRDAGAPCAARDPPRPLRDEATRLPRGHRGGVHRQRRAPGRDRTRRDRPRGGAARADRPRPDGGRGGRPLARPPRRRLGRARPRGARPRRTPSTSGCGSSPRCGTGPSG